jgi:hypothetical protein
LFPLFILAQDQFLVYSIKGKVSVVTNNAKSMASTGTMLLSTSIVNVPDKGAITFICKEGGMFSMIGAGSYSPGRYFDSCYKIDNDLFDGFTNYMWAQKTKLSPYLVMNRRHYFKNYQEVSRNIFEIWIDPIFDTFNYSGMEGDFPLSWKSYTKPKSFQFSLYDSGNTIAPFYKINVNTLKVQLKNLAAVIKAGSTYYWGVAQNEEESDGLNVINYISRQTYDSVLKKIKSLKPAFEAPAEEAYRMAFMLENAHYFAEAYHYFSKAAILDTRNRFYRSTLTYFKKQYDIK